MGDGSLGYQSKSASAYEHLKRLAMRGHLRPGQRLSPTDLAARLRVSETPVRAALGRLALEGFVRGESNHGFFAKPWTVEEQRDLLGLLAVHYLSSLEGADKDTWIAIEAELAIVADGSAVGGAGRRAGAAFAEIVERFFVRISNLAGNAAATEVVRNAADRTHHIRTLDMEDPVVRGAVAGALGDVAGAAAAGDLAGARRVGTAPLGEIMARLPALVARANLEAGGLEVP